VLGGVLTLVSWRLIFFINVPVGAVALWLVSGIPTSPARRVPFDWPGQVTGVVAMGALTYGTIEAGAVGFTAPRVVTAFALAVLAFSGFLVAEHRAAHPMVPPSLFTAPNVSISVAVGFAFVVGYYGLPFVMSLYLQQQRGMSSLAAGLVCVPMMLTGAVLTPPSTRIAERVGARITVAAGLAVMAVGLGVFNTSRQIGGALAVVVFGAFLSTGNFLGGLRTSLLIAAAVAISTAVPSLWLRPRSGAASSVHHLEGV
jgi:MFS family permease